MDCKNTAIALLRIGIFVLISVGCLSAIYWGNLYANEVEWDVSSVTETWSKVDFNINYQRNFSIPWDIRLAQKWTNINIVNTVNGSVYQYMNFSSSIFYIIIPDEILRVFTFNIIVRRILFLEIQSIIPMTAEDCILTFQTAGLTGVVNMDDQYWDVYVNQHIRSKTVEIYNAIFFILNICAAILLIIYGLYIGLKILIDEYHQYDARGKKKFDIKELNLIYFCDNIYKIKVSPTNFGAATISSIIHTIVIWTASLLLILASYYTSYNSLKTLIWWIVLAHIIVSTLYLSCHYFHIKHLITVICQYMFFIVNGIVIFISYVYLINILLWFIIGLIIDFNDVGPFTIIVFSIATYFVRLPIEISKIQLQLKQRIKCKHKKNEDFIITVSKFLEAHGLSTRDIIISLIWGMFLLILISIWIIMSWRLFDVSSSVGKLISSLTVPLFAYSSQVSQISGFSSKANKDGDNNNDCNKGESNAYELQIDSAVNV
jgi:hypothetical protein